MNPIIKNIVRASPLLVFIFLLLAANAQGRAFVHPEEAEVGDRPPRCSECHEEDDSGVVYRRFNHNLYFLESHRTLARQRPEICSMCHQQSFCNDCHAVSTELKPSLRRQNDTFRRTQHRGDYLSRHRIDGRIDPTSCFRCHGNPKSSRSCVRCHG